MSNSIEWMKKHPVATGAIVLGAVVVVFLIMRSQGSGSSGGLAGAIAQQNQGQLQMAQLNAQLGAQQEQTQAQLAATEYQTQAQQAAQQDQLVGSLASGIIPAQLQSNLYAEELAAQQQSQQALLPLIEQANQGLQAQGTIHSALSTTAFENEIAMLLGQGSIGSFNQVAGNTLGNNNSSIGLVLPGGYGVNLGSGLFG